jgi:hypothetical protein
MSMENPKRLTMALTLVAGTITGVHHAAGQDPVVRSQLLVAGTVLQQFGYASRKAWSNHLSQGEVWTINVWLDADFEYAFAGACDADCSDLDLSVRGNGRTIADDTESDDNPLVFFRPGRTGAYEVRVHMYQCSIQPCGSGVLYLARRIARGGQRAARDQGRHAG